MTEQSDTTSDDSWLEATDLFIADAGETLGDRFAPQIKALRELAKTLDSSERYEPTLAAEYGRMHRWLLNKTATKGGGDAPDDSGPDLLDMLAANPGARWDPNA